MNDRALARPSRALLVGYLLAFALPWLVWSTTIAQQYEDMGRSAAREGLGHVEYLRRLAEAEAAARYERSVHRRTQAARLPVLKTLEQFDWTLPKKINRAQVQDLFRLRFIEQNTNVVFIGGVGLAVAIENFHIAGIQNGLQDALHKRFIRDSAFRFQPAQLAVNAIRWSCGGLQEEVRRAFTHHDVQKPFQFHRLFLEWRRY